MDVTENPSNRQNSSKTSKPKQFSQNLRKRAAPVLRKRENDVYVSTHSLQSQLKKCEQLFESGHSEVVIHGLGHAITTATNLALQLEERLSHTVELAVNTSTVRLVDDFEPSDDSEEPSSQLRSNSAIHIRVFRKANFAS